MLEQIGSVPIPGMPFAGEEGHQHAGGARHTPRQNNILAALPPETYAHVLPALEPIPLPLGWTVHGAGDRERYLYFLTAGIVARFYVMEDGASASFSITGREGVIGVAAFLGGGRTPTAAVVLSPGHAYRLRAELLQDDVAHDGPLLHLLLRYTQALIAQTGQIAACNRHHSLKQQLCSWILASLDRVPSNDLAMTQELIAEMLGVRREGVTEAAGKLQKSGAIHCSRGHIVVLNRPGIEAQACVCYEVIKREYQRLLPVRWQSEVTA